MTSLSNEREPQHWQVRGRRIGTLEMVPLVLGLLLLLVVLVLSGCSTPRVAADWDPGVDFSLLKTWSWAAVPQRAMGNPLYDTDTLLSKRIRQAIEITLASRGFTFEVAEASDFRVAFLFTVEDKTQVTTLSDYYGYGYTGNWGLYGYGGAGYGGSRTVVDQYKQGTLIVDVVSTQSNDLIWRGSGWGRLKAERDPETAQVKANEVVATIFKHFPPPSTKP